MARILKRIGFIIYNLIVYKPFLGSINIRSVLKRPLSIDGMKNIYLGKVNVGYNVWLAANPLTSSTVCKLIIKDGCHLGNFNHIYATGEVIIEENVLTADGVYISDNLHDYEDVKKPIWKQQIKQNGMVRIGEDSWLGEHVCVLGASIGKHCVIGANSVVTNDIPDYSVAVGSPARVIKKFNFETNHWERV